MIGTSLAVALTQLALAQPSQDAAASSGFLPPNFWPGFAATLIFGVVGIVLATFGFKLFDFVAKRIDIEREISEKQNMAAAIVAAAVILGTFHLIATVCH